MYIYYLQNYLNYLQEVTPGGIFHDFLYGSHQDPFLNLQAFEPFTQSLFVYPRDQNPFLAGCRAGSDTHP